MDLKNNARKYFATVSSSSGLAGGGYGVKVDIVKRFGKIVALSVANGNKDEGGSTVEASRLAKGDGETNEFHRNFLNSQTKHMTLSLLYS